MARHLIIGAGPIGRATTTALQKRGHTVTIATRSGTRYGSAESVTLDATDTPALTRAATGCDSIIVCTNPPYHQWAKEWPPIIDSVVRAAVDTQARIVLMGNLYPFGRPTGPMTNATPENPTETKGQVRAGLWKTLTQAAEQHGILVSELRASDYFGDDAGPVTHLGDRFITPVRNGKTARVIGDPDALHSWSYLPDIGECLAILATTPELSGKYWVGPSSGNATMREITRRINPKASVKQLPPAMLKTIALFSPMVREVLAIHYQHTDTYILDDSELQRAFHFTPTPLASIFPNP